MSERPDKLRAGRESATGSARAEQVAQNPPQAQPRKRRQGAQALVGVMMWRDHCHIQVRPR